MYRYYGLYYKIITIHTALLLTRAQAGVYGGGGAPMFRRNPTNYYMFDIDLFFKSLHER